VDARKATEGTGGIPFGKTSRVFSIRFADRGLPLAQVVEEPDRA